MVRPGLVVLLLAVLLVALGLSFGLCVQDDAFISFRYAANLAAGHGLVFNPGQPPVEGYSNFLWTLVMAGVIALGGNPVTASVTLGLASSAALLWVSWALAREFVDSPWPALLAPALVAADAGLALESVQGLETAFFALLVGLGLLLARRDRWPAAAGVLALAALTRPEGPLVFGLLLLARLPADWRTRRTWEGAALFTLVVGAHLVFRLALYGEVVPNTFHAKVGGGLAAVSRGGTYLFSYAWHHVGLALGAVGGALLLRRRAGALLLVVGAWLAYVVAVGGDFKGTWRFLVPVLAPLAALAAGAAARRPALLVPLLLGLAVGVDLPRTLPAAREDAAFRARDMEDRLTVGRWLRDNVAPGTLLAIHSAGTIPYAAGLPTVDLWGLSDRHIGRARVPAMGTGTAGHEKTDYAYAFGLGPALYLPEEELLTPAPVRLPVPADFPADFEARYRQTSIRLDVRWLNLFHQEGWTPDRR